MTPREEAPHLQSFCDLIRSGKSPPLLYTAQKTDQKSKKLQQRKSSSTNTTPQQIAATGSSPAPSQAAAIPAASAAAPATGDCVAVRMAGNVITASVT